MLKEIIPFDRLWLQMQGSSRGTRAVVSFIRFLERRFGAELVYDSARIGYEPSLLTDLFELAEKLRARGVIRSYTRHTMLPDEPRVAYWKVECATERKEDAAASSVDDERHALTSALAEAIERYTWFESVDQFTALRRATLAHMKREGSRILHPERFAGYSDAQRKENRHLRYTEESSFAWVEGYSWTQEKSVWVPAQTVSAHKKFHPPHTAATSEPAIRASITTGMAVHPSRTTALLSGALEVIERDAYIITWLNQLSPPHFDLDEVAKQSASLAELLARCRRYRLEPHALRFPTDAPTYVVGAVLEDMSGALPRFSIGLKAGRNPQRAIEGALLEALRARLGARTWMQSSEDDWDPETKTSGITHYDRLRYWAEKKHADHLAFLVQGDITPLQKETWENDTDEENFERIVAWCRTCGYELASVSSTLAKANVPGWHIEFVVIPELQPLHLNERLPHIGGKRLSDIPRKFGYTSRNPYLDDPHPFA